MRKICRITTDFQRKMLYATYEDSESLALPLFSREAFRLMSHVWLKAGWACKYSYDFLWMGRPIIQLPEDLVRIQEVIYKVRPDAIIETGIAHGGTSVFYASLFEALGHGLVISIDIEIRPNNRAALEVHPLKKRIALVEGNSIAPETLREVESLVAPNERVMVVLDSNHSKAHVLKELELYSRFVSPGSYIVATDGFVEDLHDVPGGKPEWITDNPKAAVHEFLHFHPEFEIDPEPTRDGITYWPDAYLRRK